MARYTGLTPPPDALTGAAGELFMHGDLDDHLRSIALIAHHTREHTPDQSCACLEDNLTWRERLQAFKNLCDQVVDSRLYLGVLVNPKRLAPRSHFNDVEPWDDRLFLKQRAELSETLEQLVEQGCMSSLDTSKPASVEATLPEGIAHTLYELELPPAVTRLATGLFELKWRDEYLLRLIIDGAENDPVVIQGALFHAASSGLGPSVFRSLKRLATLRAPLALNGTLGPLSLDGVDADIPREHLDLLLKLGWVHERSMPAAHTAHPLLWMDPIPRQYVLSMTSRPDARTLLERSNEVAHKFARASEPVLRVEAHHLAIESRDLELAVETSDHYGADLRGLGYMLSMDAKLAPKLEKQRFYHDAARAYRWIVDRFDAEDAYAWEYFAYNREAARRSVDQETLWAYMQADNLEGGENPLYRGRLFAAILKAHQGLELEVVHRELYGILHCPGGAQEELLRGAWFLAPILVALRDMKATAALDELLDKYLPILQRSGRAANHLSGWADYAKGE